jgi:hypothetical protein
MNKLFPVIAAGGALAGTLLMAHTFYLAYLSPDKAITIAVNQFGEANLEAIFPIPFMVICAIGSTVYSFYKWAKEYLGH